jgi:DNA-directed RNA polymerase subunit M/transcription elongation factor TFIIS
MHFCSNCQNMYYIKIEPESNDQLVYYCRNCGNVDTTLTIKNICVSKTQIKQTEQSFNNIINKYTKLDPTLPRINNILCPNKECPTNNSSSEREIIYIRYDDINMKYIYLCSTCDNVWQTNNQA